MTMDEYGAMQDAKYLILDNDKKFQDGKFRKIIEDSEIEFVKIPNRSPNLNAFAERWVRSIKDECMDHLMFLRERSLRYAVREYVMHYNCERNHQGIDNKLSALSRPKTD